MTEQISGVNPVRLAYERVEEAFDQHHDAQRFTQRYVDLRSWFPTRMDEDELERAKPEERASKIMELLGKKETWEHKHPQTSTERDNLSVVFGDYAKEVIKSLTPSGELIDGIPLAASKVVTIAQARALEILSLGELEDLSVTKGDTFLGTEASMAVLHRLPLDTPVRKASFDRDTRTFTLAI